MDSITHIVLGACVGEAMAGKQIGKRAMLLGALAQSIPDIDFVASFWLDPVEDLLAHRGITHSIIFILLISPLLGWLSRKTVSDQIPLIGWSIFFFTEMLIHLFLDAFNNYGVGWFEPFSNYRVSFNTIYVADPLITLFPAIACVVLIFMRGRTPFRKKWWRGALVLSSCYLLLCVFNKWQIDRDIRRAITKQNIPSARYFTTPAPLQSFLWMVVTGDEKGYHIAYRSVFDRSPDIRFQYFPVNEQLLSTIEHHEEVNKLKLFSQGFYTVEQWSDTLVFNDLRFGQIIGWHDPKERFVFHYFLQHPASNELVVQRGRFARWDAEVVRSFFSRIRGN